MVSLGARIKKWLILGVSLTHLVESRDLFFLEAEIVDNIFQWDVLTNMRQIKSYGDMFQTIRALTVQNILKIRILSQKFFQNESFLPFCLKCFDLNCTSRKDTTIYIAWHHWYSSKHFISTKIVCSGELRPGSPIRKYPQRRSWQIAQNGRFTW